MKSLTTQRRMLTAGFSLLELLVVIAIIGMLVSYVGPKLFAQVGKGERATAQAQIDAFGKAITAYRLDTGRFPSSTHGLQALVKQPANQAKWLGPYLQKAVPLDPWGNAYVYQHPGKHSDYDLISTGPDGAIGGTGENADVRNW